jgi:hypothetical protein
MPSKRRKNEISMGKSLRRKKDEEKKHLPVMRLSSYDGALKLHSNPFFFAIRPRSSC